MLNCPCGYSLLYENCCGIFISGQKIPETPEQLMRSRYTAYTKAYIDYIEKTMRREASKGFNAAKAKKWAKSVSWKGLKVLEANTSGTIGFVKFIAYFHDQNGPQCIEELSEFHFMDGQWFYVGRK